MTVRSLEDLDVLRDWLNSEFDGVFVADYRQGEDGSAGMGRLFAPRGMPAFGSSRQYPARISIWPSSRAPADQRLTFSRTRAWIKG